MRTTIRTAVMVLVLSAATSGWVRAEGVGESKTFHGPVGLQLYSLRDQFAKDGVTPVLDLVQKWGFKYVEVAGTYGMSNADFKAELTKRGLVPIGAHYGYDRLRDDIEGVIKDAKEMGLLYVGCAWAAHKPPFDEKQCREVAAVFNKAGKAAAAAVARSSPNWRASRRPTTAAPSCATSLRRRWTCSCPPVGDR